MPSGFLESGADYFAVPNINGASIGGIALFVRDVCVQLITFPHLIEVTEYFPLCKKF